MCLRSGEIFVVNQREFLFDLRCGRESALMESDCPNIESGNTETECLFKDHCLLCDEFPHGMNFVHFHSWIHTPIRSENDSHF